MDSSVNLSGPAASVWKKVFSGSNSFQGLGLLGFPPSLGWVSADGVFKDLMRVIGASGLGIRAVCLVILL